MYSRHSSCSGCHAIRFVSFGSFPAHGAGLFAFILSPPVQYYEAHSMEWALNTLSRLLARFATINRFNLFDAVDPAFQRTDSHVLRFVLVSLLLLD